MLDDAQILKQRDRLGALDVAAKLHAQISREIPVVNEDHDGRELRHVIVAGMGGSALAADAAKVLLRDTLPIPLEVVKDYALPAYAAKHTLVIASSHSGNTEETVSCLRQAIKRGCQIAVIATGGEVVRIAEQHQIAFAHIPNDTQPRMGMLYNLRGLFTLLHNFNLLSSSWLRQLDDAEPWIARESALWRKDIPTKRNYAKQLALIAVGKTPVFYAGSLMAPVAYKWKISWNENAKNVAFWNYFPEFSHNEFIGWTSHPVEKPFAVFDLISNLENPRILKRFALSDKMLSGKRPKSTVVPLQGETILEQMLWGSILADFVSIYVGILNNVDPTRVDLIEKFKKALAE